MANSNKTFTTDYKTKIVLQSAGYISNKKLSDRPQGSIWSSISTKHNNKPVIIKVTSRKLHDESIIIHQGKAFKVRENIVKEKNMLKYLTADAATNNEKFPVTKYIDWFKSRSNYYFIQEHGGRSLFEFTLRAHDFIKAGYLDIKEWQDTVKAIFKQILYAIEYIHSKDVYHFDISLENLLINDVKVILSTDNKIQFCKENISVKLCDFGLSEKIATNNYLTDKWCGKDGYKSPECAQKTIFDAKKNDVWCMGVVLFIMCTGGNMMAKAIDSDKNFTMIMNGNMDKITKKWKRTHYVNDDIMDLFSEIFKYEKDRMDIKGIKQHEWLKF